MPKRIRNWFAEIERAADSPQSFEFQLRATRVLVRFCDEHHVDHSDLAHIRTCLSALETGNRSDALQAFRKINFGKDGIGDWWPGSAPLSESEEDVLATFEALFERWFQLMTSLAKG
jgi:hypothetical protein